jgi:hypothetical protein
MGLTTGLSNYLKVDVEQKKRERNSLLMSQDEDQYQAELRGTIVPVQTELATIKTSAPPAALSTSASKQSLGSSNGVGDIRHEAMVSYLHQQQRKSMPPNRTYQPRFAWAFRAAIALSLTFTYQSILTVLSCLGSKMWIHNLSGECEGVMLRRTKGQYLAEPVPTKENWFMRGCQALNLPAAMTIDSSVVRSVLASSPDAPDIALKNGLHVQLLPSMEFLCHARKAQSAAFVAWEQLLIVWDDGL